MTGKKVNIGLKPGARRNAEDWVQESSSKRTPVEEPDLPAIKRLPIDVPADLHRTLKMKAASEGVKMADLVREWIREHCR